VTAINDMDIQWLLIYWHSDRTCHCWYNKLFSVSVS